jgi:hypothetical protein
VTKLARPLVREVDVPRMRPVIIEIDPERGLGFREKGTRKTFYLPVMTAYRMAVLSEKEK